jgi:hypothetical protein
MGQPFSHGKDCQCADCQQQRLRQRYGPDAAPVHRGGIWTVVGVLAALALTWWLLHTWYVDTHCTMVLGTQVCK